MAEVVRAALRAPWAELRGAGCAGDAGIVEEPQRCKSAHAAASPCCAIHTTSATGCELHAGWPSGRRSLIGAAPCLVLLVGLSCSDPQGAAIDQTPLSENEEIVNRGEGKDEWWDALPRAVWAEFERVEQTQDWFEVYRIRPGVLAIYEPGQFEEVISYLIVGAERALLFDSGLGIGDMLGLVGELTSLPVVVVNSHTHYDHVGGNHLFDAIYGVDLDYTRSHAAGREHGEVAEFVGPGWIWKDTPPGFAAAEYVSLPFSITDWLVDGQRFDLGGVELEVLLTPGHAPDSLCLLDRERRLLLSGDTFYPATLYAHLPGSSFDDYVSTAGRLAGLAPEVDWVLPAHNEPTMPSDELIALEGAFEAVQRPLAEHVLTDGYREYMFETFSILVSDPPPWLEPGSDID